MTILFGALIALFLGAEPAAAAPIGAAIAAALTSIGVGAATAAAIGTAIVQFAIGATISALARALQGKPERQSGGIKTETEQTGGTNPQSFILGTYATAGTRVCPPMSHGSDNAYLTCILDLADVPITTLQRVWIDGEEVPFDGAVHEEYGTEATGRLAGHAWLRFHDGTQTEADAHLLATYGDYPERPWQSDMVLRGVPYAILTYKFDQELYNRRPRARFEVRGMPLYDPRADSSVGGDGPQRWADPATWAYTPNPQVMIYNVLRGITLPDGSVWGIGAAGSELPLANWFAAMNACDERIDNSDGTTRLRYRAGLEVRVDEEPLDVIDDLNKACGGDLVEFGGYWHASVGAPDAASAYITDEDVLITEPRDYQPFPGLTETYNAVAATYPDPASAWETTDAVPLYNPAWEAQDRGRRLTAELQLDAVPFGRQVRALMRELAADNRRHRTHAIALPPDALGLLPLQSLSWTSGFNGYQDKLFEITRRVLDPQTLCAAFTLRERDPSDYDPDALSDGILPTPPGRSIVTPEVDGIDGWSVQAIALGDGVGAARRPAIRMSWLQDIAADAIAWEITVAATGELVSKGTTADVGEGQVIVAGGILPDTDYSVRGRAILKRRAQWTVTTIVTTPDIRIQRSDIGQEVWDAIEADGEDVIERLDGIRADTERAKDALAAIDLESVVQSFRARAAAEGQVKETKRGLLLETDEAKASVTQLEQTILSPDGALAALETTLTAEVDGVAATLSQDYYTIAQADSAISAVETSLSADIGHVQANLNANYYTEAQTDSAISAAELVLEAEIQNQSSRITDVSTTLADLDGVVATQYSELTTAIGENEATISETKSSVDGVSTYYALEQDNNGAISGMYLMSDIIDGNPPRSDIILRADRVGIMGPGNSPVEPFRVYTSSRNIDGQYVEPGVYITDLKVDRANVRTFMIEDNSISLGETSENSAQLTFGTSRQAFIGHTFQKHRPQPQIVTARFLVHVPYYILIWTQFQVDGVDVGNPERHTIPGTAPFYPVFRQHVLQGEFPVGFASLRCLVWLDDSSDGAAPVTISNRIIAITGNFKK